PDGRSPCLVYPQACIVTVSAVAGAVSGATLQVYANYQNGAALGSGVGMAALAGGVSGATAGLVSVGMGAVASQIAGMGVRAAAVKAASGVASAAESAVSASTPIGRVGNPINVKAGTNAEAIIEGRQYGGHALDQMQGRGVMPSAVENTVRVGTSSLDPIPGRVRYYDPTNNLTVITESNGNVVTVITGKR
ncbi:MAG: hypothetical protein LBG44_01370, partial [Gemmatimonadota bacterium]|nr:hypothetical protein [Gemmatimonadota bacterium]